MDFDFDYITTAKEAHATWGKRRKMVGLRQEELALELGMTQGRYSSLERDFSLVKFKKLAGGGYFKIINQSVPLALRNLGYKKSVIDGIINYAVGTGSLKNCPHINEESLKKAGLNSDQITVIENSLQAAFDIAFCFSPFSIGDKWLKEKLGLSDIEIADPDLNILALLGFSKKQISSSDFKESMD